MERYGIDYPKKRRRKDPEIKEKIMILVMAIVLVYFIFSIITGCTKTQVDSELNYKEMLEECREDRAPAIKLFDRCQERLHECIDTATTLEHCY